MMFLKVADLLKVFFGKLFVSSIGSCFKTFLKIFYIFFPKQQKFKILEILQLFSKNSNSNS